jgi:hypothetical protein
MNSHFPQEASKLFSSKGKDIVLETGIDIIKGVVLSILSGRNLRDSTELLTRRRIMLLNAATLVMMIRGTADTASFGMELTKEAYKQLSTKKGSKEDRWMAEWVLGLTDKAFQNVLRDDSESLRTYTIEYANSIHEAAAKFRTDYGELAAATSLSTGMSASLDWDLFVQFMSIIGAQTLTIRGSDKSTFGKLFEKLILGALLTIFGFKMVDKNNFHETSGVFWMSSREDKRESDATLLYSPGRGVRFDIGFIGRGNPEISLDKVSRFERQILLGRTTWDLSTIIIVDRIGARSRVAESAIKMGGRVIQMSGSYWPVQVAAVLHDLYGYDNKILRIPGNDIEAYLKEQVDLVRFGKMLNMPAFSNELGEDDK